MTHRKHPAEMTDAELEKFYDMASRLGEGPRVDEILAEMDRRKEIGFSL